MNELIDKVISMADENGYFDIRTAIEFACKAQRNACARVVNDADQMDGLEYNVLSAEIERQDYE